MSNIPYQEHMHHCDEEIIVIEECFCDEYGVWPVGTWVSCGWRIANYSRNSLLLLIFVTHPGQIDHCLLYIGFVS